MAKSLKFQFRSGKEFIKFILPYKHKWLVIIILSALTAGISLINPFLIKIIMDKGIVNRELRLFVILLIMAGAVYVCEGILNGIRQFLERDVTLKVNLDLNKRVFIHLNELSFSWFKDKSTGEHLYRMDYDIVMITDFITHSLPQAVYLFPKLILTTIMVLYLNWKMAIFCLGLAPFLYLTPYYFSKKMEKAWKNTIEVAEDICRYLQEIFSHIQLIKVVGREASSVENYLNRLMTKIKLEFKNIRLEILAGFSADAVSKIIIGLIAFYGGSQVIKGHLSLGGLTAIMVYLRQLMGLQSQFASFFQTSVLGLVSCERVSEILNVKSQIIEAKDAKEVIFKKAQILFKNVSFGYSPQEYILKNISFYIEGGSHIVIVGHSGCGKTTLLDLLVRLYDPWGGEILIDGYNLKVLKLKALKNQIGFALQQSLLWNDTLENNIRYAKDNVTEEEIFEVSALTGVDEFVKDSTQGYQTVIGENACKISEGQKQKIAIARALIKGPKILILDEAMSCMDSNSEEKIICNIKQSYKALTLISVSHRLSTVMNADRVYFFTQPDTMIVDSASNLLSHNKEFCDLFAAQSKICV